MRSQSASIAFLVLGNKCQNSIDDDNQTIFFGIIVADYFIKICLQPNISTHIRIDKCQKHIDGDELQIQIFR